MKNTNFLDSIKKPVDDLIPTLEDIFLKKAPVLPKGFVDFIVGVLPILTLIIAVFSLVAVLGFVGVVTGVHIMYSALSFGLGQSTIFLLVDTLLMLFITYLSFKAYKPLSKKQKKGWYLMYYVTMLGLVFDIVMFDWVNLIISGLVGFYLLFQIKERYN